MGDQNSLGESRDGGSLGIEGGDGVLSNGEEIGKRKSSEVLLKEYEITKTSYPK